MSKIDKEQEMLFIEGWEHPSGKNPKLFSSTHWEIWQLASTLSFNRNEFSPLIKRSRSTYTLANGKEYKFEYTGKGQYNIMKR